MDALLTLLLLDAAHLARGSRAPQTPQLVIDAAALIERRFREPLGLGEIADALAVSPSHLTRLVRRATGRSVGDWVRDRRIEEARRLLRQSDAPVEAIAREVGYSDVTHFRRQFRRAHNTTPARWRKHARIPHVNQRRRSAS
jgi:AraC-like DNA-binding protein